MRSSRGLVGNTLDVDKGSWKRLDAGVGAGVDSYYEYLLKVGWRSGGAAVYGFRAALGGLPLAAPAWGRSPSLASTQCASSQLRPWRAAGTLACTHAWMLSFTE
jgi:hypothetical protein